MNKPHHPFSTEAAGVPFQKADGAVILLHGRGSNAREILHIRDYLNGVDNLHFVAPQAAGNSWYPNSFLSPLSGNSVHLDDALRVVDSLVHQFLQAGMTQEKIFIGGFSQGACLAAEYLCRNPRRFGGVFCLAGGLIGDDTTDWNSSGSTEGTPVYLACAEEDPYIPLSRVHRTKSQLELLDCRIDMHTFPGSEHRVTEAELHALESMLNHLG